MRGFWSSRDGNIVITFALLLFPLVGFVGVALDYSMATAYRTDLQKALDATALALTKIMPAEQATLDEVGNQYFQANLGPHNLTNLQLTVTPDVGTLRVSVKGTYNVQLAHVIGATSVELGASAEARWSIGKVEIALVLDNSGSMTDFSRMDHLKTAAHDLLKVLQAAAREPDDAKVAIVAFDQRVNVGTAHREASWLRWDLWEDRNGTCNKTGNYNTRSDCTDQKVCTKPQYTSKSTCENNNGSWVTATWTPKNHSEWNGCVEDRSKDNDVTDAAPSGNSTRFPAAQCQHGLSFPGLVTTMHELSTNWTTLGDTVNAMQPSGYTNIAIGLVWGWHLISPTDAFSQGAPYNTANLQKYIILMTDGDNTRNRFGDSSSTMNTRTTSVCTNAKAAGVQIYTIRLVNGNATLLQGCASNASMYYDVQDASELSAVFSSIGSQIANLHLSK